jgi:2-polyprenyl-3-methyl-5-hydroxy-6-metoxy-1,4-benzoquinol methylase
MNHLETLSQCPVCQNKRLIGFLETTDYFLSKEPFAIQECTRCGFRFTNPRPDESHAAAYYQSEDYISHDIANKGLLSWIYTTARNRALRKKYQLIRQFSSGDTLLDIGCGTGEFIQYCSQKGMKVAGVEPSEKARTFAQKEYNLKVSDDYLTAKYAPGKYHVITLWHVMEHIYRLSETWEKLAKDLHPDGTLIIALPNCEARDAIHYGPYWAAYDVPRHIYHFTPATFEKLAKQFGWNLLETLPMQLDAYYIALLSEQFKGNKFPYPQAIIQGFLSNQKARSGKNGWSSQIYILKRKKM